VMLSALATLGIVGGASAIALSTPAVKEKLNISFADNVLFGKGQKPQVEIPEVEKPEVEEPDVTTPAFESFEDGLLNRNLIMVDYEYDGETHLNIQNKNSLVELFDIPANETRSVFLGWTKDKATKDLTYFVDENTTLYPVFYNYSDMVDYNYYGMTTSSSDYASHGNLVNYQFGVRKFAYKLSANTTFTGYLLGLANSPESTKQVKEIVSGQTYYEFYYIKELNRIVSLDECKEEYKKMQYGEKALYEVTLKLLDEDVETYLYKADTYIRKYVYIHEVPFYLMGYSTSPDSTSYFSNMSSLEDGKTYYGVYRNEQTGESWTYNMMITGWDITLHRAGYSSVDTIYDDISEYELSTEIDGIPFEFIGWSTSADSTEVVTVEQLKESESLYAYGVYKRSDTEEIISYQQYNEISSRYITRAYTYDGQHLFVHFLDKVENDCIIGDVTYEFAGWASSGSSTAIITNEDTLYSRSYIYAVYKDADGTLYSNTTMTNMYNNAV